jgi:Mg2+-importing ATPase
MIAVGLSTDEAKRRLEETGPNEPVVARGPSLVADVARRFANPLVAVLLAASAVSAVLREVVDASIIVSIVAMSAALELLQTTRSTKAAERLRSGVAPTATVRRDGKWIELSRREVVPGDVIRLSAGDLVPADAELVESKDLHVQEAALTGESLPAEKEAGREEPANLVWLGSSVVSGTAIAVVRATGASTSFGRIAAALAKRRPQTELERSVHAFGVFIMKTVLSLLLFVFASAAVLKHDALDALLFAIALAVGLTPEFLPMITTVTLAQGAVRMSHEKVIVKNLAAIQHLGSIDILCCDKTGTLTTGELTLEAHVDPMGSPSELTFRLAYVNSFFETGVANPYDTAVVSRGDVSPLDVAVLKHGTLDVKQHEKIDEMPFDFERRRMSVVVGRGEHRLLVTKGAPEHVLAACETFERAGVVHVLDEGARARCREAYERLGEDGHRVLAVAYGRPPKKPAYDKHDETALTLIGFLAFADPPLEDAGDAIALLGASGVEVKILTGDAELVAEHVCKRVGLDPGEIVLGPEVDRMTDPALAHVAEKTRVFARVTPAQKNRVVAALRARGHVVGFIGDGINDAPSLHSADVGVSVASAVDVAKDAADVILLERHLKVLHAGVVQGRRAFGNVMKYLLMGTSSNFGNMFSMAGAYLALPFLPMLPTQILLNNFLYDVAQITIPMDNVDEQFLKKPRRWDIALIRRFMILIGPLSSLYDFLTFWVLLRVFHAPPQLFHSGWFVESLATQTLVIFVIRTASSPLKSRPSRALALTACGVVVLGAALPFSPIAHLLGFVPLPMGYFFFLSGAVVTYLCLVQLVKRVVMRRLLA